MKRSKVLYPGTFDPITCGHIDVIQRACRVSGEVLVGIAKDTPKNPLFDWKERVELAQSALQGIQTVTVKAFSGLTVAFARREKISIILRGIRMLSDFEYEFQMALTNRKLAQDIETVFMMPHPDYSYISSKLIKEAFFLGADVSSFVPQVVLKALQKKDRQ